MSTTQQLTRQSSTLLAPQLDFILLDGSSSMHGQWWDSLRAIDEYITTCRGADLNSQVLLATFDTTDVHCIQRDSRLADWRPLLVEPIGSHGGRTPLYDAINIMGRNLHSMNPERCHILIVTDGEENASVTTQTQAKAILDWCRAKGYQVTFIGADFNNSRQAELLGSQRSAAIGVTTANLQVAARNLATKRIAYGRDGDPIHFTETERSEFGGYLAAK